MKAQQRSLLTTPGAQVKPSKTKKSKGNKKRTEKSPEVNSSDLQRNLKAPTEAKDKNTIPKLMGLIDNSVDVMTDIKKNQRKQDANEWKSIKKVECQRLETVLEEGQLSSEETPSKQGGPEDCSNSGSYMDCEPFPDAAEQTENKRTNEVNGVSDKGEFNKTEEECEDRQKQTSDKGDFPDDERYKEPIVRQQEGQLDEKAVAAKWNINLNGMMEIYPIFSNDRFLCSRDAISIQEYDDIEPLEKHRSLTGDGIKKENQVEEKPVESVPCTVSKDRIERKPRYKMLTDRALIKKTSSHFINSLLVLTPFASEHEQFFKDHKLGSIDEGDVDLQTVEYSAQLYDEVSTHSADVCHLKTISIILCISLSLLSISLACAWKCYEPPCFIDYILQFIPFIGSRRTYTQQFFDELIKIIIEFINQLN